jgi:solute carrier family 25 protein 44
MSVVLEWSEIDKVIFFGYGTVWYSTLTILLHPMTLLKCRQQVWNRASASSGTQRWQHAPTLAQTWHSVVRQSPHGVFGLFRGVGIIVSLAIPARLLYIGVLEWSRAELRNPLYNTLQRWKGGAVGGREDDVEDHQVDAVASRNRIVATSVAGGLAGGVAAVAAQILVVPMDVISQRQMVDPEPQTVRNIVSEIRRTEGWRGLYRGFGLSIANGLPAGIVWWSTYSGCQHWIQGLPVVTKQDDGMSPTTSKVVTQIGSGITAGLVAATVTQPIDVVKTRLQVDHNRQHSYGKVAHTLYRSAGLRGFYRGLGPRAGYLALWGTCLSSLYELLRYVSRIEKSVGTDNNTAVVIATKCKTKTL